MKNGVIVRIVSVLALAIWGLSGCSRVNLTDDIKVDGSELQKSLAVNAIDARDKNLTMEAAADVMDNVANWLDRVSKLIGVSPSFSNNATSHKLIFREQARRLRSGDTDLAYAADAMVDAIKIIELFRLADEGKGLGN